MNPPPDLSRSTHSTLGHRVAGPENRHERDLACPAKRFKTLATTPDSSRTSSSTWGPAEPAAPGADASAAPTLLVDAAGEAVRRREVGTHWQCFSTAQGLWGIALWGCPRAMTVRELLGCLQRCFTSDSPSWLLLDLRGLTGIEASGLELLLERSSAASLLLPRLERRVMVRPPGSVGTVAAAFFRLLDLGGEAATFTRLADALSWLVRPAPQLRYEEFMKACDPLQGGSPLIARLRAEIVGDLGADLDTVATRLELSGRTLQRRLRRLGTSYQDEVNAARLDEARRRMKVQDVSLTCVALDLGFGSGQNFSRWFRQRSGMTPSHWRATSQLEEK